MKMFILGFFAVSAVLCAASAPTAHAAANQNAGYCPQGTHPRPGTGLIRGKVPNVTTDCVPDAAEPKKKKN
jgi:hypothetical protein